MHQLPVHPFSHCTFMFHVNYAIHDANRPEPAHHHQFLLIRPPWSPAAVAPCTLETCDTGLCDWLSRRLSQVAVALRGRDNGADVTGMVRDFERPPRRGRNATRMRRFGTFYFQVVRAGIVNRTRSRMSL